VNFVYKDEDRIVFHSIKTLRAYPCPGGSYRPTLYRPHRLKPKEKIQHYLLSWVRQQLKRCWPHWSASMLNDMPEHRPVSCLSQTFSNLRLSK